MTATQYAKRCLLAWLIICSLAGLLVAPVSETLVGGLLNGFFMAAGATALPLLIFLALSPFGKPESRFGTFYWACICMGAAAMLLIYGTYFT